MDRNRTSKKDKNLFDAATMDIANKQRFNIPKTKVAPTPKPKTSKTPKPKFTPPSLAQYKKSAAYKAGDMTYKEYIKASKQVYKSKNK